MKSEFTIEATAAAFETLSTKLYSNPRLAVIRELSTNANDANIENGAKRPFLLHIPTSTEPWFSVRDFGKGLTPDEVALIYTSFFASTKTQNDAVTGAFGLGSKSPFALTDRFKVISYNNGHAYEYSMTKENGVPMCELKSDTQVHEDSGLYVEVPIEESKQWGFNQELQNFYKSTTYMPAMDIESIVGNLEKYVEVRNDYTHDTIKFESTYEDKGLNVNVAGVGFRNVDLPSVKKAMEDLNIKFCNLMVGKNDVTITPSREELHFDEKTVKFLEQKFHDVADSFFKSVTETNITYDQFRTFGQLRIDDYPHIAQVMSNLNKMLYHTDACCINAAKDGHLMSGWRVERGVLMKELDKTYIVTLTNVDGGPRKNAETVMTGGSIGAIKNRAANYLNGQSDAFKSVQFIISRNPIKTQKVLKTLGIESSFIEGKDFFVTVPKKVGVKRGYITNACLCFANGQSVSPDVAKELERKGTEFEVFRLEGAIGRDCERAASIYVKALGHNNVVIRPRYTKDDVEKFNEQNVFTSDEYMKLVDYKNKVYIMNHTLGIDTGYECRPKNIKNALDNYKHIDYLKQCHPEVQSWIDAYDFVMNNEPKNWSSLQFSVYSGSYKEVNFNFDKYPLAKSFSCRTEAEFQQLLDYIAMVDKFEEMGGF